MIRKSKIILLFILLFLFSVNGFSEENSEKVIEKKVVYDLTVGEIETIEKRLIGSIISNTEYYQSKLEEYKVKVVIHGDAYKFFMQDVNNTVYAFDTKLLEKKTELGKRLKSLTTLYDVEFEVCEVGVKNRKLNPKAFYPFVGMVHNAIVGLVDAQNDGYAYIAID
jgi:hypothetical protein